MKYIIADPDLQNGIELKKILDDYKMLDFQGNYPTFSTAELDGLEHGGGADNTTTITSINGNGSNTTITLPTTPGIYYLHLIDSQGGEDNSSYSVTVN